MTSTCSHWSLGLKTAIGPVTFLGFVAFTDLPLNFVGVVGLCLAFHAWSHFRRRSTLRQRDDGV